MTRPRCAAPGCRTRCRGDNPRCTTHQFHNCGTAPTGRAVSQSHAAQEHQPPSPAAVADHSIRQVLDDMTAGRITRDEADRHLELFLPLVTGGTSTA